MLYDLFPSMPAAWLFPLAERFAPMLAELPWFTDISGCWKMMEL